MQIEVEWQLQKGVKMVAIEIGTLGKTIKHLEHHLYTIGTDKTTISQLHKATLFGTAYFL